MQEQLTPEVVDTLCCEVGKRPRGAPTIDQVLGSVTALRREDDSLLVRFDPLASATVLAVVEAERLCCPTIGWQVDATKNDVELRIVATPLQLDALEAMFGSQDAS